MRFVYRTLVMQERMACTHVVVSIMESQLTAEIVVLSYSGFAKLSMHGAWCNMMEACKKYYTNVYTLLVMHDSIMASSRWDAGSVQMAKHCATSYMNTKRRRAKCTTVRLQVRVQLPLFKLMIAKCISPRIDGLVSSCEY